MNRRRSLTRTLSDTITKDKNRILKNLKGPRNNFKNLKGGNEILNTELSVTGPTAEDTSEYKVRENGVLKSILVDFPIGSHYAFTVDVLIDNAPIIFKLRGNAAVKELKLKTPVSKGTIISVRMESGDSVKASSILKCYVDIILEVGNSGGNS